MKLFARQNAVLLALVLAPRAARVGAQAIDIESGESFDRSRREQPRAVDPAGPDFPCIGLAPLPLVLHGRDIPI